METIENSNQIRLLFGKNLKRLRALRKISQLTLASQAGLTHNFINDIENGKKWVSSNTIGKLSTALDVEPYQFFIPETRRDEPANNFLAVYFDEFSDSLQEMVSELKSRYIQDKES
jgi:transcriptional regulator with XRE-family HTH domain